MSYSIFIAVVVALCGPGNHHVALVLRTAGVWKRHWWWGTAKAILGRRKNGME